MINDKKIVVVLPAYHAEKTLAKTVGEIDRALVDDVIVVDDASLDDTVRIAKQLDVCVVVHDNNRGYGANQKTCYKEALSHGADIVVMLHPDYQYTPKLLIAMASMIAYGQYDMVLGSRILGRGALKGGMPLYKYIANRFLTAIENLLLGIKLSEFHTGYRAYSSSFYLYLYGPGMKPNIGQQISPYFYAHTKMHPVHIPPSITLAAFYKTITPTKTPSPSTRKPSP